MRQATALGFKLMVYLVIFGVTMPTLGAMRLSQSVVLAAVHTLLLWLADLVVLPRLGNTAALIGDAMILVVGSFLVLSAMIAIPNPFGLVVAVLAGMAFEAWFHKWLLESAIVE